MNSSLSAYAVALSFGDGGPLSCNAVIANSPEVAAALWTLHVARLLPEEKRPLAGVIVVPLAQDFLEQALRASRGTLTGQPAQVFSFVPAGNSEAACPAGAPSRLPPRWPPPDGGDAA